MGIARAVPGAEGVTGVVHVLRHGEVFNPDKVLYGRLPGFNLSSLGRDQAVLAADFLAQRDVGYLVSSPLERAIQTATPLAERLGLSINRDPRLIEAENKFQGQQVAGGTSKILLPANWKYLRNPKTPSWGEPYAEVAARMLAAVKDAIAAADGREAVCVTHQLPVVALRRFVQGLHLWHNPKNRECSLASVTTITFEDGTASVEYNEPAGATPKGAISGA
ncbi:MAG: fructose-2,6-bisphosphatase [Pseudonocardiales bacterium]|nr:fructose-2,6-bisphosphatase [Pseudonocardiales bacterium]